MLSAALAGPNAVPAQEGGGLLDEGMREFLDGMTRDLEPLLRDFAESVEPRLRGLVTDMGPLLETLAELMSDLDQYEAPERLPNGDIIIRRKPAPEAAEPPAEPSEPIEL